MIARRKIGEIHAAENARARELMNRREAAFDDALIELIAKVSDAADLLAILTDPESEFYDSAVAMLAEEVRRQIDEACEKAVGAHAAVTGDILGTQVH